MCAYQHVDVLSAICAKMDLVLCSNSSNAEKNAENSTNAGKNQPIAPDTLHTQSVGRIANGLIN